MQGEPIQQTSSTKSGPKKREIAYKLTIGDIAKGNPVIDESPADIGGKTREIFKVLELGDNQIIRVNVVANVIEKFVSEGEKRWASVTIDDASGQIKIKAFGDDIKKFDNLSQGETILAIGFLKSFNKEVYILPDIIKKIDPRYLLVRKLEIEKSRPSQKTEKNKTGEDSIKEKIIEFIKSGEEQGGIDIEQLILKIKEASPDSINSEVIKLLEQGIIYEPRPGKVRWLG